MISKIEFASKLKLSLTEVLLIVVGVSIALAADSWFVEKSEETRTNQLLDALEVEWAAEIERMNTYTEEYDRAMEAMIRIINAHTLGQPILAEREAAALLQQAYNWRTFNPSEGALNALLADGIQNIDEPSLRLAVGSWHSVLGNLVAEQAALRELGAVEDPRISTRIVRDSGKAIPSGVTEYSRSIYGMEQGDFALAATADDEWVANQSQTLGMMLRYQQDMVFVRDTLERNLSLLRERKRN